MLPSSPNAVSDLEDATTDTRPLSCVQVGLDCQTCVRHSARKVAALCSHLKEGQQSGIFFQLYRDRACHKNMRKFQREYDQLASTERPAELETPLGLALALA